MLVASLSINEFMITLPASSGTLVSALNSTAAFFPKITSPALSVGGLRLAVWATNCSARVVESSLIESETSTA